MSKVCARRLIAGTVKPETSPRARASYSAWMLADRAPSSWLASQTSHCAAAVVASSSLNAAVQARSRMRAVAECGLVIDDQPLAVEVGAAGEGGQQVGGRGRDVGHRGRLLSGGSRSWYRRVAEPSSKAGSAAGLDHHQEDDDDDQERRGTSRRAGSS